MTRLFLIFSLISFHLSATAVAQDPNLDAPVAQPGETSSAPVADRGVVAGFDIRIDFGNDGTPPAANWNLIAQGDLVSLNSGMVDFNTGAVTSVSVDGTGSPWSNFFGDDTQAFPNQDWVIQPSTEFGAGLSTGVAGSYTFSGLGSSPVRVEIVSARTTFDYQNIITVGGSLADRTALGTPVETPWGSNSDGLIPGNWLIWDTVSPVGGVVTLDVEGDGTLSMINAVRIIQEGAAPPPAPPVSVPTGGTLGWLILFLAMVAGASVVLRRTNLA